MQLKKLRGEKADRLCIIAGIALSFVFLSVGYWVAAAIPNTSDTGFGVRFLSVLKHPFGRYVNLYTPAVMICAFVLAEVAFLAIMTIIGGKLQGAEGEEAAAPKAPASEKPSFYELDGKIISELRYNRYSEEQIKAMSRLGQYMPDVTAALLMDIFDEGIPADEIKGYIDIFYGEGRESGFGDVDGLFGKGAEAYGCEDG